MEQLQCNWQTWFSISFQALSIESQAQRMEQSQQEQLEGKERSDSSQVGNLESIPGSQTFDRWWTTAVNSTGYRGVQKWGNFPETDPGNNGSKMVTKTNSISTEWPMHRRSNSIDILKIKGAEVTNPEEMKNFIASFYQELYKESENWRPDFTLQWNTKISTEEQEWLERLLEEDEILEGLKQFCHWQGSRPWWIPDVILHILLTYRISIGNRFLRRASMPHL